MSMFSGAVFFSGGPGFDIGGTLKNHPKPEGINLAAWLTHLRGQGLLLGEQEQGPDPLAAPKIPRYRPPPDRSGTLAMRQADLIRRQQNLGRTIFSNPMSNVGSSRRGQAGTLHLLGS